MSSIARWAALALAALALGAAPALAQNSPFSLPAGQQGQSAPAASSEKSPFALPRKQGGQAQAPAAPQEKSPFALPGGGQGQAPAKGKSPFALPQAKPQPGGPSSQQLLDQGVALAKEGKLQQAQEAFWQAVRAEHGNAVAWNNLGLTLRRQGQLNQAMEAYKRAIEADQGYAVPYKNLGVLLEKAGEKAMAAKAYRRYAKLAPEAPDAATVNQRAAWLEARGNKSK